MNWYSFRKFLYGTLGDLVAAVILWLGQYLTNTPVDNWMLRAIITGVGVVIIAKLRQKFFPGLFGAP